MNQNFEKRLLKQQNNLSSPALSSPLSPFANRQFSSLLSKSPGKLSPVTPNRCSDRFIPSRAGARWHIDFSIDSDKSNTSTPQSKHQPDQEQIQSPSHLPTKKCNCNESTKDTTIYQCLLKNELLGAEIDNTNNEKTNGVAKLSTEKKNLFTYALKMKRVDHSVSPYTRSAISSKSQKLLRSTRHKPVRNVPNVPYKILDAPDLQDDFYLNILDWSSNNVLCVGLGSCVYLWNASTSKTHQLCDLYCESDKVTSLQWNEIGNLLAIGTRSGCVQIWDVVSTRCLLQLDGHTARVAALAWNGNQISSGSNDRTILQRDIRLSSGLNAKYPDRKLTGHNLEVCGLKWSPGRLHLASGGNDNKLLIWDARTLTLQSTPAQSYRDHKAAVRALAWSPHQHGLLASGGGTSDHFIRFRDILTERSILNVETNAQVCNLAWSIHSRELVSTHGFSDNHIIVWKYPSMVPIARLTGHTYRVLHLALSPLGEDIVTGAGDETLRFWTVFSKSSVNHKPMNMLNLFTQIR